MNCKKCGGDISEGLNFCPSCGEEIVSEAPVTNTDTNDSEVVSNTEVVTNASETEVVTNVGTNFNSESAGKFKIIATVIGIVIALVVIVVRFMNLDDGFVRETPNDLEYATYVYTYEDGSEFVMTYGYKNDVIYTETDAYIYDTTGWTQEEIDETIAYFDEYAEIAADLDCYEYVKEVSFGQLRFEDRYYDLGMAETLKALSEIGFLDFGDDRYDEVYLSMELEEESLLEEGFVKQEN